MSKNINLIIEEEEGLAYKKRLKKFRLIAVGWLLLVLLISLSVYLLNLRFSSSSIEEQKSVLLSQLTPLREKEAKVKVINDRVNNIASVQGEITDVYKIVNTFLSEIPNGMTIDNLEFGDGAIGVNVSSDSLIMIEELINNLVDMAERKELTNLLILNSLDVDATGKYSVSIKIGLI